MKISARLALACTLVALGAMTAPAHAGDGEQRARAMMKMEQMDKNKDSMISRAEFLETMGKVWDMKAREMKLKPAGASAQEMQQILKSLYSDA